ncbi:MAG TPA: hypothetical protein VFP84_22345 [Kofleriaceae bacterium]|nr:hypothetical protein [Kofleriaceae bacterium]
MVPDVPIVPVVPVVPLALAAPVFPVVSVVPVGVAVLLGAVVSEFVGAVLLVPSTTLAPCGCASRFVVFLQPTAAAAIVSENSSVRWKDMIDLLCG